MVAGIPSAFRAVRVAHGKPPTIRFQTPMRNGGRVGTSSTTLTCPDLAIFKFPVPRTDFTEPMSAYMQDMKDDLARHEDMLCHDKVDALGGEQTFVCHYDSTLEDLAAFIRGLNRGRPDGLALDTVFVNYGMYLVLFGNDPRLQDWTKGHPDYRNMTRQGGVTFFHYGATPQEYGYAMSREQGPVFVHGPTTVSCGEDEVAVERYCAVAAPPDSGVPEVPWGVRFNVVMEWKRGKSAGGGGEGA